MLLVRTTALVLGFIQNIKAEPYQCSQPPALDNAEITCPHGTDHFQMCSIECDSGYVVSGPSRIMCWCRDQDDCEWKGGASVMCKPMRCDTPFFDAGRVLLADKWPGGFAGVIEFDELQTNRQIRNGWSVVLVFDRPLGQDAALTSWSMQLSASSFYGQTFTLANLEHNIDFNQKLESDAFVKILFVVENIDADQMPDAAYVGIYSYRNPDASCTLAPRMHPISPVTSQPLPSPMSDKKPAPPTRATKRNKKPITTKRPRAQRTKNKNRRRKKPLTTASPTSMSTIPRPTVPRPRLRKLTTVSKPAVTRTTTNPFTSTATLRPPILQPTTRSTTTTTTLPEKGRYCQLQKEEDSFTTEKPWTDRGVQSFNANAKVTSKTNLKEWSVVLVFDIPIDKIQVWSAEIVDSSSDGMIWNFGPLNWDEGLAEGDLSISFIATTRKVTQGKVSAQVFLCSDSFEDGDALMTRPKTNQSDRTIIDADSEQSSSRRKRAIEDDNNQKVSGVGKSESSRRCARRSKSGYPVRNANQTSLSFAPNKDGTKYNYNELLHKSILFFEAQRSGCLPSDQRVLWRGDSGLNDGSDINVDVTGGWYDAGNFVKYNFPMAFSLTTLAWGGIAFRDAYEDSEEMANMVNLVKWTSKYFIKCHISKNEFVAQVGDSKYDDSYWGRPEEINVRRPTYKVTVKKPGTEVAAEAAAALAASSIFLKKAEPDLSAEALKHAKELYEFANKYRREYHLSIPSAAPQYKSYSGYDDELIWASTWLHKASNEIKYLKDAGMLYSKIKGQWAVEDRYVWDRKLVGAQALLAEITGNGIYRDPLVKFLDNLETSDTNPMGMMFTDEWAPNRYTSGAAFIALIAGTITPHFPRENAYIRWATEQMGMILGDKGRSYVIGFGNNYPKKARHSSSSCPRFPKKCDWSTFSSSRNNYYILYGGMVGGTDESGYFEDDRSNIKGNHVACDYNAVFQSAIAGLKHYALRNRGLEVYTDAGPPTSIFPTNIPRSMAISYAPLTRSSKAMYSPAPSSMQPFTGGGIESTSPVQTRPPVSEKVRCSRRSPVGVPIRNAKQIIPDFKPNNDGTKHNYNEALHLSLLFFEIQRAGRLPLDNRVPWRGDSALKDGCDVGADVSGGWFDAGDHVKFGFPMAFSLTTLAWGGITFQDAYKDSGELNNMIKTVKWGADFFIKAHTAKYELIGQVGNGKADHDSWGRPETMSMKRPAYKITARKPGTELAAEAAAGLAASSLFLKAIDPKFAAECLRHAEELYEFADKYRGLYHESIKDAKKYYKSFSGYDDELIWGAAWLYKATRNNKYLQKANENYNRIGGKYVVEERYAWDRKLCGAQAILGEMTGRSDFKDPFFKMIDSLMRVRTTPQGMHFLEKWGSNRYAAGAAFMAIMAAKMNAPRKNLYEKWARRQIDLMLGDSGRSYIVGYGKNYPKRPHHRSSSCPPYPKLCDWSTFHSSAPNYYILYGALVGGPDEKGRYKDKRSLYEQTEVTTDYNACFQSAVSGVKHFVMKKRRSVKSTVKPRTSRRWTPKPSTTPWTRRSSRKPVINRRLRGGQSGTNKKPFPTKRPYSSVKPRTRQSRGGFRRRPGQPAVTQRPRTRLPSQRNPKRKPATAKPITRRNVQCRPPKSPRCLRLARQRTQKPPSKHQLPISTPKAQEKVSTPQLTTMSMTQLIELSNTSSINSTSGFANYTSNSTLIYAPM